MPCTIFCQVLKLDQLDKKSRKTYAKALKCLNKGKKEEGIKKLVQVSNKYPGFKKGSERLAGIYLDNGDHTKVIELLKKMSAAYNSPDPKVAMSISYPMEEIGDYNASLEVMNEILKESSLTEKQRATLTKRQAELEFRKHAYEEPLDISPVRLGDEINTNDIEYHPAFNADGSLMVHVKVSGGKYKHEDLYISKRVTADSFEIAEPISSLNTEGQEGAFALSQDGMILIFTACGREDAIGGCDLYLSLRKGLRWSEAINMGSAINSEYWDSTPSLSTDGKTLYFSSKRPGGYGGSDIWVVKLNKDNKWDEPKNLGPNINTSGNEETPYFHPDNSALYFVSDGHVGLGSYDLFIARKETIDSWGKPKNLGYPINTKSREGGLFVDLSGNRAYYSTQIDLESSNEKYRGGDIYYFDLPDHLRPALVTYVKVIVRDSKTKGQINATADLVNLDTTMRQSNISTRINGTLLTTIQPGEYALNISKTNYLFHSENILLKDRGAEIANPFVYEIYLQPIEKEVAVSVSNTVSETKPIVLNNIFFETASAQLLDRSAGEISRLIELLDENPELRIKIIGHTDNIGNDEDNQMLSSQRAKAVFKKLKEGGISNNRLAYEGRGEAQPIADNDTKEGRRQNRRTEFVIIR